MIIPLTPCSCYIASRRVIKAGPFNCQIALPSPSSLVGRVYFRSAPGGCKLCAEEPIDQYRARVGSTPFIYLVDTPSPGQQCRSLFHKTTPLQCLHTYGIIFIQVHTSPLQACPSCIHSLSNFVLHFWTVNHRTRTPSSRFSLAIIARRLPTGRCYALHCWEKG